MKRYIRTKNGKIYCTDDICVINEKVFAGEDSYDNEQEFQNDILKQADTIEELIEVGDLVNTGIDNGIFVIDDTYVLDHLLEEHRRSNITEFYTKQGRNYVLVWTKEEGVI